jgi:hypothetical protein
MVYECQFSIIFLSGMKLYTVAFHLVQIFSFPSKINCRRICADKKIEDRQIYRVKIMRLSAYPVWQLSK